MSLISLILALALEQWRPLVDRRRVFAPVVGYAGVLERQFNAGEAQHGMVAWLLAVVPLVLLTWFVYTLCVHVNPLLGVVFNVAVLYVTMGFRQESHYFTAIHKALKDGDVEQARSQLAQWRGHTCEGLTQSEIVQLTIESALATSHRHVFGAIFWFVLLPGPTGAVLYRLALFLEHRWAGARTIGRASGVYGADSVMGDETDFASTMAGSPSTMAGQESVLPGAESRRNRFGEFARRAFYFIDWLPARFTAASFAIVGNFEDAIYCWRTQAARWADPLIGIVIAAGGGALGVRLGNPIVRAGLIEDRPEMGVGDEAEVAFLDSTVGLVWRALVLWLAMLLVVTIAAAVS